MTKVQSHLLQMQAALTQAQLAAQQDEVPVGAVLVLAGKIVAQAHNQTRQRNDPCAHAEMLVLQQAAQQLQNYRLNDAVLYVTLEPCPMCAGAIFQARLKQVIYAVADEKIGAAGGAIDLFSDQRLNHHTQIHSAQQLGAPYNQWQSDCRQLLQQFFRRKRQQQKQQQQRSALPEQALRSSSAELINLPGQEYSCFNNQLPALAGLRMHYLDTAAAVEPSAVTKLSIVALSPRPLWSYCFVDMWQLWQQYAPQVRLLAPDLIGFGQSDKWKKVNAYSLEQQLDILLQWLELTQPAGQLLLLGAADDLLLSALASRLPAAQRVNLPPHWLENMYQLQQQQHIFKLQFDDQGHTAGMRAWQLIDNLSLKTKELPAVDVAQQQASNHQFAQQLLFNHGVALASATN